MRLQIYSVKKNSSYAYQLPPHTLQMWTVLLNLSPTDTIHLLILCLHAVIVRMRGFYFSLLRRLYVTFDWRNLKFALTTFSNGREFVACRSQRSRPCSNSAIFNRSLPKYNRSLCLDQYARGATDWPILPTSAHSICLERLSEEPAWPPKEIEQHLLQQKLAEQTRFWWALCPHYRSWREFWAGCEAYQLVRVHSYEWAKCKVKNFEHAKTGADDTYKVIYVLHEARQ